jgi:tRNA A-37 threonylcarbamoyl transferase component Bud32
MVLSKEFQSDDLKQNLICFKAIDYFAKYHERNFYHGDIKPDNLMFLYNFLYFTSDAGSLLYLGDED